MADQLSKEELAELSELEDEDKARREANATEAKRQHLEALRLVKRLGPKYGKPGLDFVVLETKVGNIAIRRPVDVEIDKMGEDSDDERGQVEAMALAICIEPSQDVLRSLMAQHHGLAAAITNSSAGMLHVLREEDSKK